ncbi:MAG: hypothetical protein EP330_00340 [Deltaproteobacteria bacterium]|nr:MAG: hypothetical protein EP330_00340 [Deltaproteobacteria bacterium]
MPEETDEKDAKAVKKAKRPPTEEVPREPTAEEPVSDRDDAHSDSEEEREHPHHDEDDERGLFGRFTRKLRDRRELTDDAWKAVGAVISTSDRAKSDFIRMLGREVRHYLDGLQLTEDLRELVTNHSLEVHASLHLKPLPKQEESESEDSE